MKKYYPLGETPLVVIQSMVGHMDRKMTEASGLAFIQVSGEI
jgi:hypothetical protein